MEMNGTKDFNTPLHLEIKCPDRGFFGYLLRCRCPQQEDVSGNFIFLDDGTACCVRFPSAKSQRDRIRVEWNRRISRYRDIFEGQIYYVNEELAGDFVELMKSGSEDAVRMFLNKFLEDVRASLLFNTSGIEPLYAVSHVCQFAEDNRMHWPHIHVLWGIKRKIS